MIQNNMSVRKNKRQARKYPSTDFLLLLCIMLFCRCSIHRPEQHQGGQQGNRHPD